MPESAGGIGGLLAVWDANGTPGETGDDKKYVYFYNANGDVGQVVDPLAANVAASLVATYVYDPYGQVVSQTGSYAAANTFRFSTKQWDDDAGLGYWDYRYYSAKLRRWVSRDPIGERGGYLAYGYVQNTPSRKLDRLGLISSEVCEYSGASRVTYKKHRIPVGFTLGEIGTSVLFETGTLHRKYTCECEIQCRSWSLTCAHPVYVNIPHYGPRFAGVLPGPPYWVRNPSADHVKYEAIAWMDVLDSYEAT